MREYRRLSLAERFWPKVHVAAPSECWDWRGALTTHGYGYLGRTPASSLGPFVPAIGAHVASWILHHGPIPEGMQVCHTCDWPRCVNPSHLFLGTQADNNRDRSKKGRDGARYRANWNAGFSNPGARLDATQVATLRARYAAGRVSQDALAAEYGISQATVSRIIRRVVFDD